MGLEPTTFELEVQHASPLRHGGYLYRIKSFLLYQNYNISVSHYHFLNNVMYIMVIELRKVHVDLKLHTRFQTKIALYCLQLPPY